MPRFAVAACLLFAVTACAPAAPPEDAISGVVIKTMTADTDPLAIDAVYHSMEGPWQRVLLDTSDVAWITGFRTDVVDAASGERLGDEFFCHSQLQLATTARLAVAATGIEEIRFPDGFGLPIEEIVNDMEAPWNEVSLLGMVLNNHGTQQDADVKLRFTVDYVEPGEYGDGMQKLYKASVPVVPNLEHQAEETAGWERGDTVVLSGESLEPVGLPDTTMGKPGHWMVPPGKQVIRQRYRNLIGVGTSVHYGLIHMHNYGVSMKLTDLTDGAVLWETSIQYEADRVQISEIPPYSSAEGFVLHPDHEYEIESVYDNTSPAPVDAMAVMYLYHHPLNNERISYPIPKTPPTESHH